MDVGEQQLPLVPRKRVFLSEGALAMQVRLRVLRVGGLAAPVTELEAGQKCRASGSPSSSKPDGISPLSPS